MSRVNACNEYGGGYRKDGACKPAILALGKTPNVDMVGCSECPFPLCIRHEARVLENVARNNLIAAMHSMRASTHRIAARAGVSVTTVYKVSRGEPCYWCKLDARQDRVFCRSKACTVAWDEGSLAVVLSTHKKATEQEVKLVETLVETLFPAGTISCNNNAGHDHWTIGNVDSGEANAVYDRMEELSEYAPNLR